MSIINEVSDKIKDSLDSTNLKFATRDARSASDTIKTNVRDKMAKLTDANKASSDYANLVSIHDQIESNHDAIYLRPESGVSASSAKEDCDKILVNQEALEVEFNLAFAELTSDPDLVAETAKLEKDRKQRDAKATAEQVKEDAISKAEDVKEAATDKANEAYDTAEELATETQDTVCGWQDTITDKAHDLGDSISDTFEDAKDKVQRPKPRP